MIGHHTLKPNAGSTKSKKRVGRGDGSKGNFSGRGVKGQKARTGKKIKAWFEGGQTPMLQRMPKLRGFKNPNKTTFQVVNIEKIAKHYKDGETLTVQNLYEKGLIAKISEPVKILATGEISHAVTVEVDAITQAAKEKIEKAGGSCKELLKSGE